MALRLLFIGDIFAKPGRAAVRALLPSVRQELMPDVIIANAENIAGGAGLTEDTCKEALGLGIEALTTGNHVWDHKEILRYIETDPPVLRPLNYPEGTPGKGWLVLPEHDLMVVSLMGRVFMRALDDPFRVIDQLLEQQRHRYCFVDFHAEATAEKKAMAFHLDGRISGLVGTHTHVPTADAQILPEGTAYISDSGMVGPEISVIGTDPKSTVRRYLTHMPSALQTARGPVEFNAVVMDLDESTGLAESIQHVHRVWSDQA